MSRNEFKDQKLVINWPFSKSSGWTTGTCLIWSLELAESETAANWTFGMEVEIEAIVFNVLVIKDLAENIELEQRVLLDLDVEGSI